MRIIALTMLIYAKTGLMNMPVIQTAAYHQQQIVRLSQVRITAKIQLDALGRTENVPKTILRPFFTIIKLPKSVLIHMAPLRRALLVTAIKPALAPLVNNYAQKLQNAHLLPIAQTARVAR
jgi:hypothetical protein